MTGYYDIVLGLIPVSLVGVSAALLVVGFALTTAVSVASVVGVGLVGHAMFVNGPAGGGSSDADETTARSSRDSPVSAD